VYWHLSSMRKVFIEPADLFSSVIGVRPISQQGSLAMRPRSKHDLWIFFHMLKFEKL